ncbi:MAG TPA: VOC family protein [Thermoplasmata archaeon]|nr:VOC family protein [Thermoplasmata archaeon]
MRAKLTYTGIRVRDLEKSIQFYTSVLGMKVTGRTKLDPTGGETVGLVSEDGGHTLELNYYTPGSRFDAHYAGGEALDHLAFKVDDLDQALRDAAAAGHASVLEMNLDGARWAYITDPDGIHIELFG